MGKSQHTRQGQAPQRTAACTNNNKEITAEPELLLVTSVLNIFIYIWFWFDRIIVNYDTAGDATFLPMAALAVAIFSSSSATLRRKDAREETALE